MNERFEQMMLEATKDMPQGYYVPGEYFQKFAELIVSECARVADQWVDDEDNGHNLVSERLRQHFGVES